MTMIKVKGKKSDDVVMTDEANDEAWSCVRLSRVAMIKAWFINRKLSKRY